MADNIYKFRRLKWGAPKRFRAMPDFKPRRRRSPRPLGLIVMILVLAFATFQAWNERTIPISIDQSAVGAVRMHVVDGDTIRLNDGGADVRLVGFNTPEGGERARCDAERQKADAARRRLRELVRSGRVELRQVSCSCPPGMEGTQACNYGRRCGVLRVDGVDVGATLTAENLAVRCTGASCSSLRRPWC